MNSSPQQHYAYRRNPTRTIHASTFQPEQFGHSHGYTVIPSQYNGHSSFPSIPSAAPVAQAAPPSTVAVLDKPDKPDKPVKPSPASSGFSLASLAKYANVDEWKGLVDRFGGLDGILSTVTTVQKVISTVGQIAPMVKVFGSLGKGPKNADQPAATPISARRRSSPSRNRRNSRRSHARKRSSQSLTPRKSTPYTKRPANRR